MRSLSSMAEQSAVNRSVVGSSPIVSAIFLARWRSGLTHMPFTHTFMVLIPFAIGISMGALSSFIIKKIKNKYLSFTLLLFFLCASTGIGILIDYFVFNTFCLNYLLIGMK